MKAVNDYKKMLSHILVNSPLLGFDEEELKHENKDNNEMDEELAGCDLKNIPFEVYTPFKTEKLETKPWRTENRSDSNRWLTISTHGKKHKEFTEHKLTVPPTCVSFYETTDHILCAFAYTEAMCAKIDLIAYGKYGGSFGRQVKILQILSEGEDESIVIGAIEWVGPGLLSCGTRNGYVLLCDIVSLSQGKLNGVTKERVSSSPIVELPVIPARNEDQHLAILTQSEELFIAKLAPTFTLICRYRTINVTSLIQMGSPTSFPAPWAKYLAIQGTIDGDGFLVVQGTPSGVIKQWEVSLQAWKECKLEVPESKKFRRRRVQELKFVQISQMKQLKNNTIIMYDGLILEGNFLPSVFSQSPVSPKPQPKSTQTPKQAVQTNHLRHCIIPTSLISSLFPKTSLLAVHRYGSLFLFITVDGYLSVVSLHTGAKTVFEYSENYEVMLRVRVFESCEEVTGYGQEFQYDDYGGLQVVGRNIIVLLNRMRKGHSTQPTCLDYYLKTLIFNHTSLTIQAIQIALLNPQLPTPKPKALTFKVLNKHKIRPCQLLHTHNEKCYCQVYSAAVSDGQTIRILHDVILDDWRFDGRLEIQDQVGFNERNGVNRWRLGGEEDWFVGKYW